MEKMEFDDNNTFIDQGIYNLWRSRKLPFIAFDQTRTIALLT